MANIVVFDLADREGGTPVDKTVNMLQQKFPQRSGLKKILGQNTVQRFSLFDLLANFHEAGAVPGANLAPVKQACTTATKIFLCIHGKHNDTDKGFASLTMGGGVKDLTTWQELANFMLLLMPTRDEVYNLALVMCYGARTENFRLDNQGDLPANELKTSFAYKFYSRLCQPRTIRMTARTGAVQFDTHSGHSMVETEEAVNARADQEEYLREQEAAGVFDNIKAMKTRMTTIEGGRTAESVQLWMDLENRYKQNPDAPAANADEQTMKTYRQVVRRKEEFRLIMEGNPDRSKYGKLVYTYVKNTLSIHCKYPKPGHILYRGPLIDVA